MRAAFLVGIRQIIVEEVEDPVAPEDGLVMQVKACGVCGSDLRRWWEGPPAGVDRITPGHEVSGVVVEIGKSVHGYQLGDRLSLATDIHCDECYYCHRGMYNLCDNLRLIGITPGYPGGFAEKMVLTSEILTRGIVNHMPDTLSFELGALAEPWCSILATHERAGTSLKDTVVVLGAGPAGCLHVATAKAQGAYVIVSDPSDTRRQMVQQFGPDVVLDPSSQNTTEEVRSLTGGIGADIVICANPVAATHAQAVEMVRKRGQVILYGGLPKADPMTHLNGNLIHYGEIEVRGAFSYHPTKHKLALDLLDRGVIPVGRLITHKFPLERIGEAFEAADRGEALKPLVTSH